MTPLYPPREKEPYKKRELFEKRLAALRAALQADAGGELRGEAAEDLRTAALGVLKARRHLLEIQGASLANRQSSATESQLVSVDRQIEHWMGVSVEELVANAARLRSP